MICKKCGNECPDGNIFCTVCGAELDAPVLPENIDEKGNIKKTKKAKPVKEKVKKEKKKRTPEEKAAFVKKIKIVGIGAAVIAAAIIIIIVSGHIGDSEGYNISQSIPLGRNVEFAESETGLDFTEKSTNGMINSMSDFDYIYISDSTTSVSGSEQPKWVIMLTVGADNIITDVEYYDFKQLELNWKGRKMADLLDQNSLEYGMSIRNVNKALGLKPYYIKRSVSNDSMFCYRYYYTDTELGYDRAYNYYVEFSELESSVRNVSYDEIDYARTILAANPVSYDVPRYEEFDEPSADENAEETSSEETAAE